MDNLIKIFTINYNIYNILNYNILNCINVGYIYIYIYKIM